MVSLGDRSPGDGVLYGVIREFGEKVQNYVKKLQKVAKLCKTLQNLYKMLPNVAKRCKTLQKIAQKDTRLKTKRGFFLAVLFPIEIRTLARIIFLMRAEFLALAGIVGLGIVNRGLPGIF